MKEREGRKKKEIRERMNSVKQRKERKGKKKGFK